MKEAGRKSFRRHSCATMGLAALLWAAAPVRAQLEPESGTDFSILSANALVGAVSAGVTAWLRGEDFSDAFVWGAVGGTGSYLGKRIASERFDGAGFLGREVAAVGHSVIENVGRGEAPLSQLWFPVGPVRVRPAVFGSAWSTQVDVATTSRLLYSLAQPELDFDWGKSLQQGTPVFVATGNAILSDGVAVGGTGGGGVIWLSGTPSRDPERRLIHETTHIIQGDFAAVVVSYPVEGWLRSRYTPQWAQQDWVQLGAVHWGVFGLVDAFSSGDGFVRDLIESEADFFDGSPRRDRIVPALRLR